MTPPLARVGVYGVGHFGYALLRHLERKAGTQIELRAFDREPLVREGLALRRRHPIHESGTPLSAAVRIVGSVAELLDGVDTVVLAVTSHSTREVATGIGGVAWRDPITFVNTAKALDFMTGRRLSEVFREALPRPAAPFLCAALSGGTIAGELLHNEPLGMTIACEDHPTVRRLRRIFESPQMWVQTTGDMVGVEYAGALKNVIAICAGMVRGLGFSFGAETHLISRMASEVEHFCVDCMGAQRQTFSIGSQCWGSDLWMSCTGPTRNRRLGELLGQGNSLDEANAQMAAQHKTVEGVQTLRAMDSIFRRHPDELPLMRAAERVILHREAPRTLIDALMHDDDADAEEEREASAPGKEP